MRVISLRAVFGPLAVLLLAAVAAPVLLPREASASRYYPDPTVGVSPPVQAIVKLLLGNDRVDSCLASQDVPYHAVRIKKGLFRIKIQCAVGRDRDHDVDYRTLLSEWELGEEFVAHDFDGEALVLFKAWVRPGVRKMSEFRDAALYPEAILNAIHQAQEARRLAREQRRKAEEQERKARDYVRAQHDLERLRERLKTQREW